MSGPASATTIWDRTRLGITIGSVVLIFLAATEALAVTTVMPVVSADLNGQALFAVAFSGTLATGVIGMVAAGAWSDRSGPRAPLYAAIGLFVVGLIVAGAAGNMLTFIVGRLIQGLGAGGQTVALYVVVARVYPPDLHGRIFAAFAAAWVVPSMIGPFLAGAVAEFLHWRWAFLGVAVLTVLAFVLVASRLRRVSLDAPDTQGTTDGPGGPPIGRRMLLALVVAAAAVSVGFAADAPPVIGWPLAVAAMAVLLVAIVPLLPRGTLRARPGLPSVILMRGLAAGAFFAAEAYVPKLLIEDFAFSPTVSGLALTFSALAWSSASAVQGRYGDRMGSRRIALIGIALVVVAVLGVLVVALTVSAPWTVLFAWAFAGAGMGLLYPRLTVLTLAYSTPANEGFNSSALSISDSTGSAVAIAVAGLGFVTLPLAGSGFVTVYVITGALLVLSLLPGLRLGDGPR
ncbi:MFS transporter [Microbacterium sp.]|uniref:MFS transporter n=1 Tax=Microbacterium sp. TaxID=51671 RepID=UPI002811A764|nr:MFS transporter [Microbacterium sp.]